MIYLLLLPILFVQFRAIGQEHRFSMEIVESIPVETNLDNADIRNTTEVWLEMIKDAKHSLDLEQFYISPEPGEPLDDILKAIEDAAERGVKVRFIVDSRMYKTYPKTVDRWMKIDSMGNAKMHPEARVLDFSKLGGGIQHAKFFLVDGEEVFFGSQNFDWRALKHIHELGIRLKHKEAVEMYQDIFELDWMLAAAGESEKMKPVIPKKNYQTPFRFLSELNDTISIFPTCSPKNYIMDSTLWDETQIVRLISQAKQGIELQFLSYSTRSRDKSYYSIIQDSLKAAAGRGVKVKMIVSDWEKDSISVDSLKALSTIPNIELKYSVIPEWSGGYISYARVEHCKYIVVDGSSFWLGTSNCEKSYFHTSRNVGIVCKNIRLAGKLQNIFLNDWMGKYTESITREGRYSPREHGEKK